MNILLTGGTGLIGRALCEHWLAQNKVLKKQKNTRDQHQLWVLSRTPEKVEKLCGKGVVGLRSVKELDAQDIHIHAVINLAGAPIADKSWSEARKKEITKSRVSFTHQLVGWIASRSKQPHTLISGSAVGYYGDCGDRILDDYISEPQRDFASQMCHQWEVEAFQAILSEVRVVCLRTGLVLSDEGGFLARLLPLFRVGLGGPLGTGKQWMPWIHIQDTVRMIEFFLNTWNTAGSFNVCAPNPVTAKQFASELGKALHRPALVPTPVWALQKRFGDELTAMILSSQRAIPKRAIEAGFRFTFTDLDQALDDLFDR